MLLSHFIKGINVPFCRPVVSPQRIPDPGQQQSAVRFARDGISFDLTCAQVVENVLKERVFITTFLHNIHPGHCDPYIL